MKFVEQHWYTPSLTFLTFLLLPFSWLFRLIVLLRRFLYHLKKPFVFPVPVIVVGNITVGGTGKTPFVIWLAKYLNDKGYKPGIVSRGVGGSKQKVPLLVTNRSHVKEVGDEALLLAKRTQCPMVVSADRVLAVKKLIQEEHCDIIISDDGLQHYRLSRNIEIAMIDAMRGFGNQQMLPSGPLREPISRLKKVNFKIWNGELPASEEFGMTLHPDCLISLVNEKNKISFNELTSKTVHAVAAIGNPRRFFSMLRSHGLNVIEHSFPDHYHFKKSDFDFKDNLLIIMTEKDSVKCSGLVDDKMWFVPVTAQISQSFIDRLSQSLDLI